MAALSSARFLACTLAFVVPSELMGASSGEFLARFSGPNWSFPLTCMASSPCWGGTSEHDDRLEIFAVIHSSLANTSASNIERNLGPIEKMMLPVFASSPKNVHGKLDDAPARYVLRRLLMERHGWHLPSLGEDPVDEETQEDSQQVSLMRFGGFLHPAVRNVLERRIKDQGAGILELAVFVAALEEGALIQVPRKLEVAYRAMNIRTDASISQALAESIIDLHMGAYILSEDLSQMSPSQVLSFQERVPSLYINWVAAQRFFREIEKAVASELQNFTFANVSSIVSNIEKEFVHFIHGQCNDVKDKLMDLEVDGSGRVRLLDFYTGALFKGLNEFRETMPYLHALGVVDESDPLDPRIVISNYLDGPSNCVAGRGLYSVCCVDECADLYGRIEKQVGRPEASARQLISIVQHLSSSTMQRGKLSSMILRRIHDIADHHGGVVPLHGPHFAEWMHFAYPRECTHPQLFGPAHNKTLDEWQAITNANVAADDDEVRSYISDLREMENLRSARNEVDRGENSSSCWTWEDAEVNFTVEEGASTAHIDENPHFQKLHKSVLHWIGSALCLVCIVSGAVKHLRGSQPEKTPGWVAKTVGSAIV